MFFTILDWFASSQSEIKQVSIFEMRNEIDNIDRLRRVILTPSDAQAAIKGVLEYDHSCAEKFSQQFSISGITEAPCLFNLRKLIKIQYHHTPGKLQERERVNQDYDRLLEDIRDYHLNRFKYRASPDYNGHR